MITKNDVLRALQCVHAIIQAPDHDEFIAVLVRVMHPLMRAKVTGYNEADLSRKRFTFVLYPPGLVSDAAIQNWIRHAHQNPLIRHVQKNPADFSVYKITDFIAQHRFRKTDLCRTLYRPMGAEYQIAMPFPIPGSAAIAIVFNRDFDFTERDREMLTLLQPLIYCAYCNVQKLTDLEIALEERQSSNEFNQIKRSISLSKLDLSDRERDVLRHLVLGKSNKGIAADLDLSTRTIEKYVEKILRKLKLPSRAAVCAKLQQLSL